MANTLPTSDGSVKLSGTYSLHRYRRIRDFYYDIPYMHER